MSQWKICFNEAPAISPGKTGASPGRPGRTRPRFNEAPAISPGKTARVTGPSGRPSRRFNEAPAISPGKTARRWKAADIPKGGLQ